MTKRAVGIGMVGIDFLGVVDRLPSPDSSMEMSQFSIQGGGNVGTELVTATAMGVDTTFCGKIGDDMFGDFIRKSLEEVGVGLKGLVVEKGTISPFSYIAADASSRHRLLFHTRGNCSPLQVDELDLSLLDGASALLLDGHQMEAAIAAAEYANKKEIPVILDAAAVSEGMGELLSLTTILVAAERFAAEIAPMGELEDALAELQKMGPDLVVLTLGKEGSIGLSGTKIVKQGAYQVDIVDTTGAGDVYRGAFVYSWLEGWPLEKSMRFASIAAGLSCGTLGGRAGIPERSQVLDLL